MWPEHERKPHLLAIIGPNGSGKSTQFNQNIALNHHFKYINPDDYARSITYIDDTIQRNIKAAQDCEKIRFDFVNEKQDFCFETVGSREDKVEFLRYAAERGYVIQIIFVTTRNPDINIRRVKHRHESGGHDVDPEKIKSRYLKTMSLMYKYLEIADFFIAIDNSDEPVEVCRKEEGAIHVLKNYWTVPWIEEYILKHYPGCMMDL